MTKKQKIAVEIFKKILDIFKDCEYYECLFDGVQSLADSYYGIGIIQCGNKVDVEVYND